MSRLPPEYTLALFNLLLIVVMGFIAWLVKRAVSSTDENIRGAVSKIEEIAKVIGEVRVMIAGELLPRKEHMEYSRHVDEQMNMIRKSVHDVRDTLQPLTNRVAILEALQKEKGE